MREGREGRDREGERDRERGSRAKPGIQLVDLYRRVCVCPCVCVCVYPSDGIHVVACGPIGTKFCTHMQIHLQMVVS